MQDTPLHGLPLNASDEPSPQTNTTPRFVRVAESSCTLPPRRAPYTEHFTHAAGSSSQPLFTAATYSGFMRFLLRIAANAAVLWLCVQLLAGVTLTSPESLHTPLLYYLGAGTVFAMANIILRPIVVILSIPAIVVTLGLFYFLINAFVLLAAAPLSHAIGFGIGFTSLWWAVLASIIFAVVNRVCDAVSTLVR